MIREKLTVGRKGIAETVRSTLAATIVVLIELGLVLPFPEDVVDVRMVEVLHHSEQSR